MDLFKYFKKDYFQDPLYLVLVIFAILFLTFNYFKLADFIFDVGVTLGKILAS
jgi:uncharacterized membrane protein